MVVNYLKNSEDQQTFSAGEVIFQEGDTGEVMYGVLEGSVQILHNGQVLDTVEAGGFFGEMALVGKHTRSATAVALTNCRLAQVNEWRFHFLVHETPTFATQVMSILAERLRRMNDLIKP